jgi:hypothetical protein
MERIGKFLVANDAQIGGYACLQQNARFGRAVIGHLLDPGERDEIIHDFRGLLRRDDKIEVFDDLLATAQAARDADLDDRFVCA